MMKYETMNSNTESNLEESAGRRKFFRYLEKSSIYEYEKRMLTESGCPYTLPMCFLNDEDKITAYYDFTGFLSLMEYIRNTVISLPVPLENKASLYDILEILLKLLESIRGLENYLLYPARMRIETDTIFINTEKKSVVFSYLPEQSEQESLQRRIIKLIEDIKTIYINTEINPSHNQEIIQFLDRFTDQIGKKNLGVTGMISILGMMQREFHAIYWDSGAFRLREENPHSEEMDDDGDEKERKKHMDFHFVKRKGKKQLKNRDRKLPSLFFILQFIVILTLCAAYYFGHFKTSDLLGMMVIAGAGEFWLMKRLYFVKIESGKEI